MDDKLDIERQIIEEEYLDNAAKFKKGDVVYYEYAYTKGNQQKLGLSVGIIHEALILHQEVIHNDKTDIIEYIGYRIINPRGVVTISEAKITSASEFIYREYLKHNK